MTTYSLFHDAPQYATATFPAPRLFQEEAHEALRQGARNGHRCQMLMAPTGSGKCLGRDTQVLMADGTIKMVQDVIAGDKLLGPDGRSRNVLSIASGREHLYRITPKKGSSYVINASHILSLRKTPGSAGLRLADGGFVPKDADVVNVNVEVLLHSNATARHCLKGWRSDAIHLFDRNHEEDALDRLLPPYILGAWIGDGTMGRAAISKPECKMVDEWVGYGRSIGLPTRRIASDPEDCPTWLLTNGHNGFSFNVVQAHIEMLGVARRKHIPPQYKFGPISVRLELLAGLIDSDGYVEHGGCDWISVSNVLAEDFAFVCRSVGLSAYITPCKKGISASGFVGDYWRVSVSGDLSKIPMRDKIAAKRTQKKRHLVHGITIEPIGIGDYYGFEIDGDHLFLLGDFTVTHNTFLGLRAIHEALQKGKRAIFICDRRTLIEQTSAVADSYGLTAHSVLMADHWRYDPSSPFQIASAQTLARRKWPDVDLIVIDEAHVQMSVWVNKIKDCSAHVIGLSATPFSDGLGKLFSNLVCASSMHALTESGVLVPMRVFSCTKVNMRGAATAGGEWTDGAAAERGMEIIGDVVSEWKKFASDRKTIVFGATIAHCEEMARQFNAAGVMAACFTSDTSEVERAALLGEYRKPDSALRVLLSVSALAKGFDCIAEGSMVLTDSGHKAIEKLSIDDRIWDGYEFVSHDGPIFKGERDVITYAGLTATPSHLVKTAAGWKTFMDCAKGGIPIVETSEGGRPVQEHDRRFRGGSGESKNEQRHVRVPMRGLRGRVFGRAFDIANSAVARVREVLRSGLAGAQNEGRASKMLDSKPQGIFGLWRARNRIQIFIREGWRSMGMGPSWAYSSRSACATGQDRQQRPLRAGKFAVDVKARERMQHQARRVDGDGPQVSDGASGNSICGQDAAQSDKHGVRLESDHRQVLPEIGQAKRRVWDVLNAGPRNSFTCEGLLVHNCQDVECVCDVRPLRKSLSEAIQMWGRGLRSSPKTGKKDCLLLDFSGNIVRMAEDYSDIFYNGLDALDAGEKLDKTIRRDNEEKPEGKACPVCGYQPMGKRCVSCGHEVIKPSLVEHEHGEMQEIRIGKTKYADDKRHLWEQACSYARGYSAPDKQQGRAKHIFRDITGEWPDSSWDIATTPSVQITRAVLNKIKSRNIAYAKSIGARAA